MSDSGDEDFMRLKPSLRRVIDTAFLKLLRQATSDEPRPTRKKRRVASDAGSDGGGGFVKDDIQGTYSTQTQSHHPFNFFTESEQDEDQEEDDRGIPLSLVPKGLQVRRGFLFLHTWVADLLRPDARPCAKRRRGCAHPLPFFLPPRSPPEHAGPL
jgi:hypothetical protein